MSHFTTQLRWPVEQMCKDLKLPNVESSWPKIYDRLGLADYPIFNESHRSVLNNKIIRHYYMREIGVETMELFRWFMRVKMNEIMPYYNQLYESELIEFDPLSTKDMKKDWDIANTDDWSIDNAEGWNTANTGTRGEKWTSKNDTTSEGTTSDREIFQDTPMSMLDNPGSNPVKNLQYATTVTYDDGTSGATENQTGSGDNTRTDNLIETGDRDKNENGDRDKTEKGNWHEYGYDQPGADMLQKLRDTFLNIDMMVVNEVADLFMGIG